MRGPTVSGVETTVDAFHRGSFHLVQPAGGAHRSGVDATILAAGVPDGFCGTLADLGAGAGAAAFSVLDRCPGASAVLYEISPLMAACARAGLVLEGNAHLRARAEVIEADVALDGKAREAAGFPRDRYDWVIANPPFNDPRDRTTPKAEKAGAHVMEPDLLARWIKTACAIARPGAGLTLIARPQSLVEILQSMKGRYGAVTVLPVHPRLSRPAIRIVVTGIKGSRRQMEIASPLFLHDEDGGNRYSARADAITNGRAVLGI
ncbi:tRNA1(Val) (adenine(37)-N6)-methyltransferase [Oricola thermophila]|uniref:Methyltransferase n=1 Tax=Oricola thermophila TaxID=2742145 RepID=A0A6N1VGZ6_9HYPH|nr:methyltransferase [Oricola thermophila]QKV18925.1 methyltransferase [Oricola thermophila]